MFFDPGGIGVIQLSHRVHLDMIETDVIFAVSRHDDPLHCEINRLQMEW
jgi:hypothetical protein